MKKFISVVLVLIVIVIGASVYMLNLATSTEIGEEIIIKSSMEKEELNNFIMELEKEEGRFDRSLNTGMRIFEKEVKDKIKLEKKFFSKNINFDLKLNSKDSVTSLIESLQNIMDRSNSSDEIMLISQRQIMAVENTLNNIEEALLPLQDQELEIFSFHPNEAVKEMASITRPFENDEMLDKMFGSFCLGK